MYIKVCTYSYTNSGSFKLLKKPCRRYLKDGAANNILKNYLFIFMLFFFLPQLLIAQENTFENEEPEKDSMLLYKKIKKVAYKYKITQRAYELVFVDPEPRETRTKRGSEPGTVFERTSVTGTLVARQPGRRTVAVPDGGDGERNYRRGTNGPVPRGAR